MEMENREDNFYQRAWVLGLHALKESMNWLWPRLAVYYCRGCRPLQFQKSK